MGVPVEICDSEIGCLADSGAGVVEEDQHGIIAGSLSLARTGAANNACISSRSRQVIEGCMALYYRNRFQLARPLNMLGRTLGDKSG
jgi:hypothetical protein